jgi:hypothetical protein
MALQEVSLQKAFDTKSPNFWAQLVIAVLGLLSILGIQFPSSPDQLGGEIVTTLSTGSLFMVFSLMGVSVIMPIVNYIRSKPKPTLAGFFGNPNTWVYIVSFALGLLIWRGIPIDAGTAESLVGAVFAKDWVALIGVVATGIISPLVRWLMDRGGKKETPALSD